jgi:hypothetical protein
MSSSSVPIPFHGLLPAAEEIPLHDVALAVLAPIASSHADAHSLPGNHFAINGN